MSATLFAGQRVFDPNDIREIRPVDETVHVDREEDREFLKIQRLMINNRSRCF